MQTAMKQQLLLLLIKSKLQAMITFAWIYGK